MKIKFKKLAVLAISTTSLLMLACNKNDSNGNNTATQDCTKNHLRVGTKVVIQSPSGVTDTGIVTIDTLVSGKHFFGSYTTGFFSYFTGICVESSGSVYQYNKGAFGLPDGIFPITTSSQTVGQSLYSDTIPSVYSSTLRYVYQTKLLSNNETFTLQGKNYTNGKKILFMLNNISSYSGTTTDTLTTSYYFCGLGIVKKEQSGVTQFTMVNYTY